MVSTPTTERVAVLDHAPRPDYRIGLADDVRAGLTTDPKRLPPKYFYDERGSELFEQITALPEYYQTRTERAILARIAPLLTGFDEIIEFGSGSSSKTRLLLDAATADAQRVRYIPIDVSREMLTSTAMALAEEYPGLTIEAVVGDFTEGLPAIERRERSLLIFLGGTIGNFDVEEEIDFLKRVADAMRPGDRFLLGVDLVKDPAVLHAAYNDSAGVTAEFNRNVLRVLNRELDARFDPESFHHYAFYHPVAARIEMWLISLVRQSVRIAGLDLDVEFAEGEGIMTEISRKFTRESAAAMMRSAGLDLAEWYTDDNGRFALALASRS